LPQDFVRYRRVILNMNTRYPTASAEELARADHTCIVCREEMAHPHAKKLPCGPRAAPRARPCRL
jgi:E3 ubiquitin-protein ligase synoviolin